MPLHAVPDRAWQIVATNLFQWEGKSYLVLTDYFLGWIEIDQLHATASVTVVSKLKQLLAHFGIPTDVISDNGPQYTSHDFKGFAHQWDFRHTTSSPEHSLSNGLAECVVQSVKTFMTK